MNKFTKKTRIVITGGSGFIGSNLVDGFLEDGFEVVVIDRNRPKTNKCKWIKCDISMSEKLEKYINNGDFVFHLAAMANTREVDAKPIESIFDNYVGLAKIIKACINKKASRLIFSSSYWVSEGAISGDEGTNFCSTGTNNVYGNEKIAGEFLLHSWSKLNNFNYSILRFGNPFGPRMWSGLVVGDFITKILAGNSIQILGDGKQSRQFLYVKDIYQASKAIVMRHKNIKNEIYNITGDNAISLIELINKLSDILKIKPNIIFNGERKHDVTLKFCPNNKARQELGFSPINIDTGLKLTIKWCKNNVK